MNSPAQFYEEIQPRLSALVERFNEPEPGRLDAYLPAWKLVEAVQALLEGGWHLSAITGMDIPQTGEFEGGTELLYHFCQAAAVLTLRISLTYGDPAAPSVCGLIPSATLYEREVMEMFGVFLEGTPVRSRLLLPDDWPNGVFPMRKSFRGLDE